MNREKELGEVRENFYKKITNPTLEEEEEIKKATSSKEINQTLSTALKRRIVKNIEQCVLDSCGSVYVIEGDWISEEEIATSYGIGLFTKEDYREIKTAFLDEIKSNPTNWLIVRTNRRITHLKEKAGSRIHSWQGFKFTEEKEREIEQILGSAASHTGTSWREFIRSEAELGRIRWDLLDIERELQARVREKVSYFSIFLGIFILFSRESSFRKAIIINKGTQRDKKLLIFWKSNKNPKKIIAFDYQPTKEEKEMFYSETLSVQDDFLTFEINVLTTRNLLALVKYYESLGRNKKNSQFNEFLLEELKNFRLAKLSTPKNKAYLLVNANERVDEIIEELTHLRKVQMFEPIFW